MVAMPEKSIAEREPEHPASGEFLRDIVFGANDGVVTAIGFLVGISGSIANQGVVVIAGILTIVAGSASMALGNYLGVKSQREHYEAMEKIEKWEMKHKPDVERDEIREIYTNYGFDKETVETLTKKVTSNNELWLKVMMRDELGFSEREKGKPVVSGVFMGIAYLAGGIPPARYAIPIKIPETTGFPFSCSENPSSSLIITLSQSSLLEVTFLVKVSTVSLSKP